MKGLLKPVISRVVRPGLLALSIVALPQLTLAADAEAMAAGKEIAFSVTKGNCLSCHEIAGGELPGNVGPPLVAMKARFPDKSKLRAQIENSNIANPNSIMPPFGKNGILTADEIDKVVEFIHSL